MSQSIVDACNNALQRLGAARILSLSDNSREARSCNVAYDSNRRSELRKYMWNFAKTRAVLAPDSTAPAWGYNYAFSLPTDCLRVIVPSDYDLDWSIESGKILTNSTASPYGGATSTGASLSILYIRDETNPAAWDPIFFDLMTIAMAIDMCDDLTQSNTKRQVLQQDYQQTKAEARKTNAFEVLPAQPADDPWWIARL